MDLKVSLDLMDILGMGFSKILIFVLLYKSLIIFIPNIK